MKHISSIVSSMILLLSVASAAAFDTVDQAKQIEQCIAELQSYSGDTISRVTLELILNVLLQKLINIRALILNTSGLDVIESTLEVIESELDLINQCAADPIMHDGAVSAPTLITGAVTIDSPGHYCLADDITVSSGVGITITSSDVVVDLSGRTIRDSGTATTGIAVNASLTNITIKNGTIRDFTTNISFGNACTECVVSDITTIGGTTGILFNSTTGNDDHILENCTVIGATSTGFRLNFNHRTLVHNCKVLNMTGTGGVFGFRASSGQSNIFDGCIVENLSTTSTASGNIIAGIVLDGTEMESIVTNCIIDEVTSTITGSTVPYGIFLQNYTQSSGFMTQVTTLSMGAATASAVWTSDSKYLAVSVASSANPEVRIFTVSDVNVFVPITTLEWGANTFTAAWTPDNNFLAIGGVAKVGGSGAGNQLNIYSFDGTALSFVTGLVAGVTVLSVDWSPDGNYLVIGTSNNAGGNEVLIYSWDGQALTAIPGGVAEYGVAVNSVAWHPRGNYLAIGGAKPANNLDIRIFSWDGVTLSLIDSKSFDTVDPTTAHSVNEVRWTANGNRLGIVGVLGNIGVGSPPRQIEIYGFNGTVLASPISAQYSGGVNSFISLGWSGNSQFVIGVGQAGGGNTRMVVYTAALTSLQTAVIAGNPAAVNFSPDGSYVAIGETLLRLFQTNMTGATNCVVKDCVISCVSGAQGTTAGFGAGFPGMGVGIQASSDDNLVIGNVAFNNDINYSLVNNVYKNGYQGVPTLVQNISIPPQ